MAAASMVWSFLLLFQRVLSCADGVFCYFSSRKQYLAHPRNNGCFLPNVIATTRHSFILKCIHTAAAAMGKWCNINCMPFLQAQFIQRFITSLSFEWSEFQPIFKRE